MKCWYITCHFYLQNEKQNNKRILKDSSTQRARVRLFFGTVFRVAFQNKTICEFTLFLSFKRAKQAPQSLAISLLCSGCCANEEEEGLSGQRPEPPALQPALVINGSL